MCAVAVGLAPRLAGMVSKSLATPPIPATAADGILEISATCAAQTGCFPGGTAG